MSRRLFLTATALLLFGGLLTGCGLNESADRSASVSAAGMTTVQIIAEAGELEVRGQTGLTEVDATGTAYASTTARLENIRFVVSTDGSEILIEAKTPGNAVFDVVITVPDSLNVVIEDGSGDVLLHDVADVTITDGSGDIDLRDVGSIRLTDGSGNVNIDRANADVLVVGSGSGNLSIGEVSGGVEIQADGSGNIDISNVGGDARIGTDGSGDISISDVDGNVRIGTDGSGSITVTDVGGDFTVGSDGSGTIRHSGVRGIVETP